MPPGDSAEDLMKKKKQDISLQSDQYRPVWGWKDLQNIHVVLVSIELLCRERGLREMD